MKKNYETNQLIISIAFIFITVSNILLINIFLKRYRTYKTIDSIVITDNYVQAIITDEELKLLRSSNYLYIDNERLKMRIVSIEKNLLTRNKKKYHEVIIKVQFKKIYKDNDYIKLTIYDKKEKIINIFKSCWKEE